VRTFSAENTIMVSISNEHTQHDMKYGKLGASTVQSWLSACGLSTSRINLRVPRAHQILIIASQNDVSAERYICV
jgi:hypothetical protein